MKNVTISLDEATISASEQYARANGMSLDALIEGLLSREVTGGFQAFFELADSLGGRSKDGKLLTREEIYDR